MVFAVCETPAACRCGKLQEIFLFAVLPDWILQNLLTFMRFISETVRDLIIVRLSASSGSVTGGEDMIILCEKVRKGDAFSDDYETL